MRLTANSTARQKGLHSPALVSSPKGCSELSIEALWAARTGDDPADEGREPPDEGERARLISEITRLLRQPHMPESTRTAGLTLIGWLARRMPGEAPHALGVAEARASEHRIRSARKIR